ncbi:MAG: NlpC/P60 family protein [Bacteroidota bacterium]
MTWLLRLSAVALAVAMVSADAPVQAQTSGGSTASPTPERDAEETAPRRRPARRAERSSTIRSRPTPRRVARDGAPNPQIVDFTPVSSRLSAAEAEALWVSRTNAALRADAPRWIGIPYRWGGTTRRGLDCSAFVQQYVRANLGIELPRTTAAQRYEGVEIDRSELRAGDLVFFRRRGVRHVGVYLSDDEFIHASSSRGVIISSMDSNYWSGGYWMSRRLVTETPSETAPTPRRLARRDSSSARG